MTPLSGQLNGGKEELGGCGVLNQVLEAPDVFQLYQQSGQALVQDGPEGDKNRHPKLTICVTFSENGYLPSTIALFCKNKTTQKRPFQRLISE